MIVIMGVNGLRLWAKQSVKSAMISCHCTSSNVMIVDSKLATAANGIVFDFHVVFYRLDEGSQIGEPSVQG